MGMKAKGTTLKGNARKMYREGEKWIDKSRRNEDDATIAGLKSSLRQLCLSLFHQGPQALRDMTPKHEAKFFEERAKVVGKGTMEGDKTLVNFIYKMTKRPELIKSNPETTRSYTERHLPKSRDLADRLLRQEKIEQASEHYGLAARLSLEVATRKSPCLVSRWVVVKNGKTLYSNWGTKNPAEDLKPISKEQLRYMYHSDADRAAGHNKMDKRFEVNYIAKMQDKEAYLYIGKANKLNIRQLVRLEHDSQWQVVKAINKYCTDHKQKSLVPKGLTLKQGIGQFTRLLASPAVGMTKKEAGYTLHVDRHEYIQFNTGRMTDEELALSVAHGGGSIKAGIDKLDHYRYK